MEIVTENQPADVERLFTGGGEMGESMRARFACEGNADCSQTPLGSVSGWASSLKTAVSICLNSRFPMAIWWGKDLVLLYNDAWRPILGTKHPNALGQPGQEVWSEIWDIIGVQLNGVLETAQATWSDDMLLLVDRYGYTEEAYFTYSYSPIFLETGEVGGAFTAVTETTRRVIGERRLSTLRELASSSVEAKSVEETCRIASATLANNSHDISFALLYLVEQDGKQARLAGTVRVEAGTPVSLEQVDLTQEQDSWKLAQVRRTGDPEIVDDLMARFGALPGGAWDEPSRSAIVLPLAQAGQQQQLAGLLVLGISPRLAFDDEYRGFFDLVASNVGTAIANADAYEAERKRAEKLADLDRAKTAFFSNVSHEFRTPLTLMLSPLEEFATTLDGRLQPDEREQLQLIQRSGLRLQKLVNTLLDFSRIEAGRIQAVYEPTNLAAFTVELASVFRSLIERAGMTFSIECPALPELVYVDREMWEKIVLNLISNAFKFTFVGQITVRLIAVEDAVEFSVADTGVGIPETELPRLFERFHRVSGSRSRTYEGSGIGLALVQELVKLQGGSVSVSSVLEQGTTFTVTIPIGQAHLPLDLIQTEQKQSTALRAAPFVEEALRWIPEDSSEFSGLGSELPLTQTSPARILLADDNADVRDYIKRLLSQHYDVETVADGLAALTAIRRQKPDLVLTDVMMPKLDGFGLLQQLRDDPATQDLPIVLLSARAGEEARVEGLEAGADDYLTKPFSARELLARVEASLKLSQLRREAGQREQALRLEAEAAKQTIETILSSINDGFYVFDRNWCYTYVNDRLCEMAGKPREELLGYNNWSLFPAAVDTDVYVQFHRAMREQTPIQFEYVYLPWNRWFEYRVYPSPDGLTVFAVEVTDRKQAEETLQQSEDRYRTLFESIDHGFCIIEVLFDETNTPIDYRFLEINPAFEKQSGLEQAVGKTASQLTPGLETHWYEIYGNVALTGEPIRFEDRPEVMNRWFDVYAYRIGQPESRKVAILFKDISDRKRNEAEREQLLQQEQAAREAAESANRIKDEFLAVLSHELRTPMNPILGWSKLLQTGRLDAEKTTDAIATIERNAKLQVQLIDDLLDISRILSGKLSLTVAPVDLSDVITAALETVRLAAEAKSLSTQTLISPSVGLVGGDAGRLQQVVWNLLSNAVKFTPAGGQITVELSQVGTNAQIQVRDTGKGINPQFLPYVFEHFRQEDGATTRKFGGLGLGLAIARQIVEMHGGHVAVESDGDGQGATFTVQIPIASRSIEGVTSEPGAELTLDLDGIHILVVDDDTDSREFVAFALEQAAAIVTAVSSGVEALQTIEQSVLHLIISDIGMPDMDGYSLMRQMRVTSQGRETPAIALTAYVGEYDQQQAIAAGFQKHLAKPVDPEELVKTVAQLVQRSNAVPPLK